MEVVTNLVEAHVFRIENNSIKFLLLKRHSKESYPNLWQMITGAIEENEIAYKAAFREMIEETGITINKLWVVPNVNSFYSHERNNMVLVPVFAAQTDEKLIKLSNEHSEYKWVDKNDALKLLAWPGQRKSVEIIYNYVKFQNEFLYFTEIDLSKIIK